MTLAAAWVTADSIQLVADAALTRPGKPRYEVSAFNEAALVTVDNGEALCVEEGAAKIQPLPSGAALVAGAAGPAKALLLAECCRSRLMM